jgi:hypothetical protein
MMNRNMARGSLNPLQARMAGKPVAAPSPPARGQAMGGNAGNLAQAMSRNAPGSMQMAAQRAQQGPSSPSVGMRSVGTPVGQPRFKDGGMVKADMVSPRKAMAMGMKMGAQKGAKKGTKKGVK